MSYSRSRSASQESFKKYNAPLLARAETYINGIGRLTPDRQPESQHQRPETEWRRQRDIQEALKGLGDILANVIRDLEDFGMYEESFKASVTETEEESSEPPPPFGSVPPNYIQFLIYLYKWITYLRRKDNENQSYWRQEYGVTAQLSNRIDAMFFSGQDKFDTLTATFGLYYTKAELDAGALDGRYYTETEVDTLLTNYYTAAQLDAGQLDDRYYTETEVDTFFSAYYTAAQVNALLALYYLKTDFINVSAGAGDAGKPVVLDAGGKIDATMINDGDISHSAITDLGADDHTQYHNDTRGDARYYTQTLLDAGQLDSRYFTEIEHINVSTGAPDAGKPIKLDASGMIDSSMYTGGVTDHGSLTGLTDPTDHAWASLVDGTRAFTGKVQGVATVITDPSATLATKGYVDASAPPNRTHKQIVAPSNVLPPGVNEASQSYYTTGTVADPFYVDADSVIIFQEIGDYDISCHVTIGTNKNDVPAGTMAVRLVLEKQIAPDVWREVPTAKAYWRLQ